MSVEALEQSIADAEIELKKREPRRMVAWAVITLVIFFVPIVLFFQLSSGSVFGSSYGPIVVVWLMVSLGVSNVIAAALFSARTTELRLAVNTANAMLTLLKGQTSDPKQAD